MSSPMKIIASKTRASVLGVFFGNPGREYYLRQLEEMTGYSAGNIRREMVRLESDGLFSSRTIGRIKLFKLNKRYPFYNEIKNIIRKSIGIEGSLKAVLKKLENVDFAFLYGSFAEGSEGALSDIDIIVIGSARPKDIKALFFEYQSRIQREINSIIYTKEEFLNKLIEKNHFVSSVAGAKKIFIKGGENEFRRFAQIRETRPA